MKKNITALFIFWAFTLTQDITAQGVTKNVIVEHFTNSRCSICASRNPGFYSSLNQKPDIIHIAYHPSSPYSNCLFSMQNKTENDERTRFYGLFGATPTFTINGIERFSSEVQKPEVYNTFESQTSPFSIETKIKRSTADSINVEVNITTMATHQMGSYFLYVPLAEDTVFYNAPNGEQMHFDVFRQSFTGVNPVTVSLSNTIGEVFTFSANIKLKEIWNMDRLFAIAMLQSSTQINGNFEMIQAAKSEILNSDIISDVNDYELSNLTISPNPASNTINIQQIEQEHITSVFIFNQSGAMVLKTKVDSRNEIDISSLSEGIYFLKVNGLNTPGLHKFIKINN